MDIFLLLSTIYSVLLVFAVDRDQVFVEVNLYVVVYFKVCLYMGVIARLGHSFGDGGKGL